MVEPVKLEQRVLKPIIFSGKKTNRIQYLFNIHACFIVNVVNWRKRERIGHFEQIYRRRETEVMSMM